MIIADLNLVSDITEFGEIIIGGAKTDAYTEATAGPSSAFAIANASAFGDNTLTNAQTQVSSKRTSFYTYNKASATADAYAEDLNSSSWNRNRSTAVYLGSV
jgi:hypothetical protein